MTAAVTLTFPLGHGRTITVQGVGDPVVEIPPPLMTAAALVCRIPGCKCDRKHLPSMKRR